MIHIFGSALTNTISFSFFLLPKTFQFCLTKTKATENITTLTGQPQNSMSIFQWSHHFRLMSRQIIMFDSWLLILNGRLSYVTFIHVSWPPRLHMFWFILSSYISLMYRLNHHLNILNLYSSFFIDNP